MSFGRTMLEHFPLEPQAVYLNHGTVVNSHSDPASAGTQEITAETLSYEQVAQMIDHSLLRPELTPAEVLPGCELAERYRVATPRSAPLASLGENTPRRKYASVCEAL